MKLTNNGGHYMKKLIASVLVLTLLCGCGGTTTKNTKTCSIEQGGQSITMNATASDGTNIDKVEAKSVVAKEDIAQAGFGSSLEEVEKSLDMANAMMDAMEQEGFTIDLKIENESLVTIMNFDFKKIDAEQLAEFGIDFGDLTTLEAFEKSSIESGGTCK